MNSFSEGLPLMKLEIKICNNWFMFSIKINQVDANNLTHTGDIVSILISYVIFLKIILLDVKINLKAILINVLYFLPKV